VNDRADRAGAWRTGAALLWRHVRNARGRPDRLWWVARRALAILRERRVGQVVGRHAGPSIADLDRYAEWIARYDTLDAAARERLRDSARTLPRRPRFTILLSDGGTATDLAATMASLRAQFYSEWRLAIGDAVGSAALDAAGSATESGGAPNVPGAATWSSSDGVAGPPRADDEFIARLAPGERLAEDALLRVAQKLASDSRVRVVYADDDRIDASGRRSGPRFKPDWNPEWLRTHDYIGSPCVIAAPIARSIVPLVTRNAAARDWDWRAQACEAAGVAAIAHVPRVLCHMPLRDGDAASGSYADHSHDRGARDGCEHGTGANADSRTDERLVVDAMLARAGVAGAAERTGDGWRIRYRLPEPAPKVSLVVPSRDRAALLARCVASLRSVTAYPDYEIVVVDNDSRERAAVQLLAELEATRAARIVRFPGAFNFAAECNAGVAAAAGDVVILLNNDTEIIDAGWIDELAAHALQPGVAMVGALLLYPDRTIQHAGVIVGVNGIGEHRFRGCRLDDSRIAPWIAHAQNLSAVTAACAAIRRDRYWDLGGLDEALGVANNDIDFCLRALARGFRNVWTPHAVLLHHESVSRGYENSPAERARLDRESALVRERWHALLDNDPAYNPNLARDGAAYDLAFPPRVKD
jgi:GT2 family glycosyltransferase